MPIKYNSENRVKILNSLLEEPYGWGGLLNNRDCSSFTQDYFAVFGKHLHRNSKAQTTNGNYLDISNLTLEEKKEFIQKMQFLFHFGIFKRSYYALYWSKRE